MEQSEVYHNLVNQMLLAKYWEINCHQNSANTVHAEMNDLKMIHDYSTTIDYDIQSFRKTGEKQNQVLRSCERSPYGSRTQGVEDGQTSAYLIINHSMDTARQL
eukprot:Gb_35659 [translate_table: standard]